MYYEIFEKLCKDKNVRPADVSKATGIATATLTSWKKGRYTPKADKLQKIADYFEVPITVLTNGEDPVPTFHATPMIPPSAQKASEELSAIVQAQVQSAYYDGYEAGKKAQDVFVDPNLRILMDAVTGLDESAILALAEIAKRMRGTNPDG